MVKSAKYRIFIRIFLTAGAYGFNCFNVFIPGYIKLLSELTVVGDVSKDLYLGK